MSTSVYGFMDVHLDEESSSMEHEAGSFYLFIPQVNFCALLSIYTISIVYPHFHSVIMIILCSVTVCHFLLSIFG